MAIERFFIKVPDDPAEDDAIAEAMWQDYCRSMGWDFSAADATPSTTDS